MSHRSQSPITTRDCGTTGGPGASDLLSETALEAISEAGPRPTPCMVGIGPSQTQVSWELSHESDRSHRANLPLK
ncbi:hypothetical protein NPIL_697131 [Nephila pilipes]|uniref:Uncharacterized protein n=1 Tax=Nephila pilipes TaxID=299642 RepID=A0A8X6MX14_NEPPI|nr:hypothetical protein NPIL_697131 [Nephila pilipes]